jgi:hypothetical protein
VRHASRSRDLLHVEVSQARFYQSGLKTGGGAARMVHVASLLRLHRVETEDGWVDATGYVRPFYPNFNFVIFYVLCLRSILVF